jgi:hypothetical protein
MLMQDVLLTLNKDITQGPIFANKFGTINSVCYCNAVKRMFVTASKIKGHKHLADCSSLSVRRTFAQWQNHVGLQRLASWRLGAGLIFQR